MAVVTGRCVHPDGAPAVGVYVYAWLRAASTALLDGSRIDERDATHTGPDGRWSLTFPPAAAMTDPAALWSIREVGFDAYLVAVPSGPNIPVEVGTITIIAGEPSTGGEAGPIRGTILDDLADVNAPSGLPGLLLRDPDGIVRPAPLPDVRTDFFSGDGPPPDVVVGASLGDVWIDNLTGVLYRLT